ncbi:MULTISPECIES: ABC transporter ATP-binding protein [Bradyrhizobium]|jgi:ATP-binding cassette subfamily B protein|uniref:ABC transporter ATP-binding protein n=2 Tax=Bradyrhizobium TaxID=374 RepID=A0ABS5G6H1_9BRAD|nr:MULTISPECIES: ABC transporter ATP-binding protein [Bradyrhizobium]ABQ34915.1 putative fused ATP-binding/permease protein [Bradyrhizobium sp. BTAi1]MBR1136920.1 ABC transporter ATP-binding protein [Bradyrhizobium denitrificans]MDU0956120.1 ABC transporter ATP-binding protein [Bradyrhizobium sp.]MDU1492525.1 ABC transporter ATP-binding protein [Bradyrhizobium sp.]MDU1542940.1 ABC transporter ATP-binding protein [Bradyrhizobium sp.]
MDQLSGYAHRPFPFVMRYLRMRPVSHLVILLSVIGAVACSVGTQYGVKALVDSLSAGPGGNGRVWAAFALLMALIATDNILWRVASWIASFTFVRVTGDLRRDIFRHLTGHSPSYFGDRLPGMLSSRITATSNAVFTVENMFVWNVLPPCLATVAAIALIGTVSGAMAIALLLIAAMMVLAMFRLAAAGKPLHDDFADKAAMVDGEMVDVISNMPLVRAFCGLRHEHDRFDATVNKELEARGRSLRYLEKLRILHATVTIVLTVALMAWAISLWQRGGATTGDVVLVCTLGLSILNATRDLAVALVDVTQHVARMSEAIATLLQPHELRDHPDAEPLVKSGAAIAFDNITFHYPGGNKLFENFSLRLQPGQRVGLVGQSGGGKSSLFTLLQRFYDPQAGRIMIDGQDIARVTQQSLREAISVVPQDISLFHRSILENIRYGRPSATDDEVLRAAIAARCDFVETLPEGLQTMVGDRGVKLSGGQRQRIAIARAFLKDAPILLLDEATAALDSESEEAIREALSRLMRGRTVIAIAHRLATLRNFDRVVVLRSGRIIEDGAPDRLMQGEGPYRDLVTQEMNRLAKVAA